MAIYIVIDTCNWKALISKITINKHLEHILSWLQEKEVVFLVSPALRQEWEKHREIELAKIQEKVKLHAEQYRRGKLFFPDLKIEEAQLTEAEELLSAQVKAIDEIFKFGLPIETTDAIDAVIYRHFKQRLPPFHHKQDSHNDANILFPAMEYVDRQVEPKILYFVSLNKNEFGSADFKDTIHPTIAKVFPNLTIHYFEEWLSAYSALVQAGLTPMKASVIPKKTQPLPAIDTTASALAQLHEFLIKRFASFVFLPKKYFEEQYPIYLSDGQPKPEGLDFDIYTNNEALFEALQSLSTENPFSDREKESIRLLNRNWVNEISIFGRSSKSVTLEVPVSFLDEARELFESLQFDDLYTKLYSTSAPWSSMEKAFWAYRLHDEPRAVQWYLQAMAVAKVKDQKNLQYIAGYGIVTLKGAFPARTTLSEWEEMQSLSLEQLRTDCRQGDNEIILAELTEDTFIQKSYDSLRELHRRIQAEYRDGVTGSTNTGRRVQVAFFQIHEFLQQNYLTYSHFGFYRGFAGLFAEAALLSYASSPHLAGKLAFLSDDLLVILVFFCKPADLQNAVRWHDIANVRRSPTNDQFIPSCIRFLLRYPLIIATSDAVKGSFPLRRIGIETIPNVLIVLAIVHLEPAEVTTIVEHLYPIIRQSDFPLRLDLIRNIGYFLLRQGFKADPAVLFRLANAAIADSRYYDTDLIAYVKRVQKDRIPFAFDPVDFSTLLDNLHTLKEQKQQSKTFYFLFDAYDLTTDPSQRQQLLAQLETIADQENIDPELYAIGVVMNIFPHAKEKFDQYAANLKAKVERELNHQPDLRWQGPAINNLINYCIKEQLAIPPYLEALFVQYDRYYDWLLHLDTFDYTHFLPEWLYQYFTLYFKRHFQQSQVLSAFLLKYLKEHPSQANVARFYIDTYVRGKDA